MHKVFVYGTLKSGEPNNHYFQKSGIALLKGNAISEQKYPLVIGSRYNVPFLLYQKGTGHQVKGELYEVNDEMLKHLDELEDHPNLYVREEIPVKLLGDDNPGTLLAWTYFIKNFKQSLIELPHLQEYSSSGDHGLRYMESYVQGEEVTAGDILDLEHL